MPIHNIYYIDVTFFSGKKHTVKQTSVNQCNAIITALRKFDQSDIRYITISEGIPKTEKNRAERLNRRNAAKDVQRRKREERITWYKGLSPMDNPPEK